MKISEWMHQYGPMAKFVKVLFKLEVLKKSPRMLILANELVRDSSRKFFSSKRILK